MPWPPDAYKYTPESLQKEIVDFALKPLYEAYTFLKQEHDVANFEENEITKHLVFYLKHKTSISEMCARHSVHVILWPSEQPEQATTCVPDIKFDLPSRNWLHVEAKRIYEKKDWSVTEYLSAEDGIGRILSGKYSTDDPYAAMLCYIQNGDFYNIINKIKQALLPLASRPIDDVDELNDCVFSIHNRQTNEIGIYHLFFYFS